MNKKYKQRTCLVQSALCSDKTTKALIPPIHLSATYALQGLHQKGEYDYSRTTNPTRNLLGQIIAELEDGSTGVITNSGMSAVMLVCQLLSAGDTVVIPHDCYGGTYRLFTHLAKRQLFKLIVVDQNDKLEVAKALNQGPKMLWIETPSNPLLTVYNIAELSESAHQTDTLVVVDNTFLSPLLQRPLSLGADIVVHSCTKLINGHSDIVSGAVIAKNESIGERLLWWANCIGVTASAFDSYLVMRGIRTLSARLAIHQENTHAIAQMLIQHPAVQKVYYPGFSHDPGYSIASEQQSGFGTLVSFELVGGEQAVKQLLATTQLFIQAQSLGGVESLINHPATMTHSSMPDEAKKKAGIGAGLLRLSVGIEALEDLLLDLKQSLDLIK